MYELFHEFKGDKPITNFVLEQEEATPANVSKKKKKKRNRKKNKKRDPEDVTEDAAPTATENHPNSEEPAAEITQEPEK